MVMIMLLATVLIFLAVDYVLRREGNEIKDVGKEKRSPIFISPERSLLPVGNGAERLYHLSHSWVQPTENDFVYVGYDDFISNLFSTKIRLADLPLIGSHLPQGAKAWEVGLKQHKVSQLSPISGKVVDINPACKMNLPLDSRDVAKSWILKVKPENLDRETHNLMNSDQVTIMNSALTDELLFNAQEGHYLNDGGAIDPSFIEKMSIHEWQDFIRKFFPY